jgi:thiol:disulfide interchange protein
MKTRKILNKRFLIILLGLILITFIIPNTSAQSNEIEWQDYEEGMEKARTENKTVLIDFYTDWCSWCDRMDEDTYSDSAVIDKSKTFVCVKVDGDKREDLVNKYNIDGYPTTLFLNKTGYELHRMEGYLNEDEFYDHMRFALGEIREPPEGSATGAPCMIAAMLAIISILFCGWITIKK